MGRRAKEPHLTKTNRLPTQRQTLASLHLEQPQLMRQVELRRRCRERLVYSVGLDHARAAERDPVAPLVADRVPEGRDMADLVRIVRRASIRHARKKVCVHVQDQMPLDRRWVRDRRARPWVKAKHAPKVIARRDSIEVRDPIEDRDPIEVHDLIEVRVPKALVAIVRRVPKVLPPVIVRRDLIEARAPIEARVLIEVIEVRDRTIEDLVPINEVVRSKRRSHPTRAVLFRRPDLQLRNKRSPQSWFRRPNRLLRPSLRRAS